MSKSNVFENDWLKLVFNGVTIAGIARDDLAGITDLVVAAHTADPGETGDQTTNELAYTGYARKLVPRTTAGWTVTNNSVSPAADIDFALMTGGAGGTMNYWSVGTGVANKLLYSGSCTPIVVANGVIPRITTASTITED